MSSIQRAKWCLVSFAALGGDLFAQCNSIPTAVADQVDYFGRAISVEPMANDSEPDGEALSLSISSNNCLSPTSGFPVVVQVDNGTLRLVPTQPGYPTTCSLTYTIEDEHGFTSSALVQIREVGLFADGFETASTVRWTTTITSGSPPEP